MNSDRVFNRMLGAGLALFVFALPCLGEGECSNALNFQLLQEALGKKLVKEVIADIKAGKVSFLWCPKYDDQPLAGPHDRVSEPDWKMVRDAVDSNYCEPEREDRLIRLRGSSTVGFQLAPWLAYKYLSSILNATNLKIVGDCDGKHTRVFGYDMKQSTWIVFDILETGSKPGGEALGKGSAEIAMASEQLEELPNKFRKEVIAEDTIAIIVNRLNPISNITIDQLRIIVRQCTSKGGDGHQTPPSWSNNGVPISCKGQDRIVFYSRPEGSGTKDEFANAINQPFDPSGLPKGQIAENHLEMAYKVAGDLCGIGYVSKSYASLAKEIPLDKSGQIGIPRKLYFYYRPPGSPDDKVGSTVESFIKFTMDAQRGQKFIHDLKLHSSVPVADIQEEFDCRNESAPGGRSIDGSIRFLETRYAIAPKAHETLDTLKDLATRIPDSAQDLWIVGFTDDSGSEETNRFLSGARASAVQSILVPLLAASGKKPHTHLIPCGERPIGNDTVAGREANRAVRLWWRP